MKKEESYTGIVETHQSILEKDGNNFNLIRLLAAIIVVYSHSYAITSNAGEGELIARLTGVTHAGELSVVIFFFISGALVTKSLINSVDISDYILKRVFRIYPALIVCNFFVAYLVVWIFGDNSLEAIFTNGQAYKYFLNNSLGIWNEHFIPGVFNNHPNHGLNGSLWSVTLELRLYLFLAILALIGLMNTSILRIISMIGLLVALGINVNLVPLIGNNHAIYGNYSFPAFSAIFIIGGLFYIMERHIRINYIAAVLVFGSFVIIFRGTELYRFSIFAFVVVLSLRIATIRFVIESMRIKHDYSYGTYLYGWPALQISYSILATIKIDSPAMITFLAVPLSLVFAMMSWHFIEKPCIDLTHQITGGKGRPSAKVKLQRWFQLKQAIFLSR